MVFSKTKCVNKQPVAMATNEWISSTHKKVQQAHAISDRASIPADEDNIRFESVISADGVVEENPDYQEIVSLEALSFFRFIMR